MTTYDDARVTGLEVDFRALVTDYLSASCSLGVMNAKIAADEITEYFDVTTGAVALRLNNKGNALPDTPEVSFNLALTYEQAAFQNTNLFVRAAYRYVDKMYFDTENYIENAGSSGYLSLRLGLRSERWDVVVFGDNLTDERNYSNYAYSGLQGNYLPNRPRVYGVDIQVRL